MLHYSFKLKCFDHFKKQTLDFMSKFDTEDIYIKNIPISKDLIEVFAEEMNSYGLTPGWNFLCFKRKNFFYESDVCHVDYDNIEKRAIHTSIIFPLEGCAETYMYWLDGSYYKLPVSTTGGTKFYKVVWKDKPSIIDRAYIDNYPTITRVDIPHNVTSRLDNSYRCILSVRLIGNPTFDEVIQKISNLCYSKKND
jgi:hypothetical protein